MDSQVQLGRAEQLAELVWSRRWRRRLLIGAAALALVILFWLLITAPLSRSLEPPSVTSVTFLSADGQPIARQGAVIEDPVELTDLPDHVWQAFVAIEDRRFYRHSGIDPRGMTRALWRNLRARSVREGGSTITQQLAKQSFLGPERNAARKLQEMVLALWLEANLSKRQILERYLSTAYFGDNIYGLRAAARHYFDKDPEELTLSQSAILAGLVKAPTTLAPTRNLEGARDRARLVVDAMVRAGFLDEEEVRQIRPASLRVGDVKKVPAGTYFVDWVTSGSPELRDPAEGRHVLRTTVDARLQQLAERAIAQAQLGKAQVALVAMRPDGRVVAMVGGKDHAASPFNRATQAQRQPGSAFKIFVYLAAARSGMTANSPVLDAPLTVDGWTPSNADGRYRGWITVRDAFRFSSNVATVRLAEGVGRSKVIEAARDLGISGELLAQPSLALGTSATSLLEMTAAYAAVAGGQYPIVPHGLEQESAMQQEAAKRQLKDPVRSTMLDLLWSAANAGTGNVAALHLPTFGKTGTTQDNRDAIFIGFAENLVTGVWIGNDDNSPLPNITGGGLPAEIWRDFMAPALNTRPAYFPRLIGATPAATTARSSPAGTETARSVRERAAPRGKGKGKGKKKKRR